MTFSSKDILNPIFGKSRSDKVKKVVSQRRKNEADQTLRSWIHPMYGIESNIRSIDLRDKYSLNISHLRKITHGSKYKSHKGWKLYEP